MNNLVNQMWPVGKIIDLKVKITSDKGSENLICILNDGKKFVKGLELQAIGFKSKMDEDRQLLHTLMGFINEFENGDYAAIEKAKQFILNEINNNYSGD